MSRFNLSFLRQLSRIEPPDRGDRSLAEDLHLSRRSFLTLSGSGIAYGVFPPVLRAADFGLVREGEAVHLTVNGDRRWTIDPHDFGKRASVAVSRSQGAILIRMRNAILAGTNLAADFDCTLDRVMGVWTLQISTASGMELSAPLLDWLNGLVPATGVWKTTRFRPAREFAVQFPSHPTIQFRPDWTFRIEGKSLISLNGLAETLPASEINLAVHSAQSLAAVPPLRATTIKVRRDAASWPVTVMQESEQGWSLRHDGREAIFDHLWLEAGETESGSRITALFHQETDNPAKLNFFPGKTLCTDCGDPLAIPLRNVRLALGHGDGFHSVLIADLPENPVWVHDRHESYLLAALPDTPGFELHSEEGTDPQPHLTPGLCEVCFPGEDSCVTLKLDKPRPLPFIWGDLLAPFETFAGWLHFLPSQHGKLAIDLSKGARLCIERPQDMVSLQFSFQNMWLHTGLGPKIVPVKGGEPRVLVHFPPQHVAEEAYFRTKDTSTQPPTNLPFHVAAPVGNSELQEYNNKSPAPIQLADLQKLVEPDLATQDEPDAATPQITMAGPSQLVFAPPAGAEIRCHPEALLDWSKWQPIVAPAAKYNVKIASFDQVPEIVNPNPTKGTQYTSIELPWRLHLSPSDIGRWAHSIAPVESTEKAVELWHTRLGVAPKSSSQSAQPVNKTKQKKCSEVKETPSSGPAMPVDEDNKSDRTARAIWTDGFIAPPKPADLTCAVNPNWASLPDHFSGTPTPNDPFRMSLDVRDRTELVYLTSDYGLAQQSQFCLNNTTPAATPNDLLKPEPVQVNRIMLTAMGGYLDSTGKWNPGKIDQSHQLTVQQWRHVATLGRDHYVKVMYKGFLMPLGLSASLVKVTERVFSKQKDNTYVAILHQFMYIVVKNETKQFPVLGQPFGGRGFPFSQVTPVTLITPALIDPSTQVWGTNSGGLKQDQTLFWPSVVNADTPFSFAVKFSDVTGMHTLQTSLPMVFVSSDVAQMEGFGGVAPWHIQDAARLYNGGKQAHTGGTPLADDPWLQASFGGNKISLGASSKPGDTDFDVDSINWRVWVPMSQVSITVNVSAPNVTIGPGDTLTLTVSESFSSASISQTTDLNTPSQPVALPAGNYATSVKALIGGKTYQANLGNTFFTSNFSYNLVLAITGGGSVLSLPQPGGTAIQGQPSALDLYRADLPYFYPSADSINLSSASIKRITGITNATKFVFYPGYLGAGFDAKANPGEVVLQKHPSDQLKLAFGASGQVDKAGGLASPDALVVGLSRKVGVVGGQMANAVAGTASAIATQALPSLTTFSSGKFDPADFFGGLSSAKLLGAVKLSDIIAAIAPNVGSNLGKAPQMIEQSIFDAKPALLNVAAAIATFQRAENNVLAPHLGSQAQAVAAAAKAVSADPQASLQSDLDVAQLAASIFAYASALASALQNPASIVQDEVYALLSQALDGVVSQYAATIANALSTAANQLTSTLDSNLTALDGELAKVQDKINGTPQAAALKFPDVLLGSQQTLAILAPDLQHLMDVRSAIAALHASLNNANASINTSLQNAANDINATPSSLQQLPQVAVDFQGVIANLSQVYEKAGLLVRAVAEFKNQPNFATLLPTLARSMFDTWSAPYVNAANDLAQRLSTLEDNCAALASAYEQTTSQQILQSLRQLQNSFSQTQAFYGNSPKPGDLILVTLYRALQAQQKMQGQILRALSELQRLSATAPAGASATVQQAAADITSTLPVLASDLTVANQLLSGNTQIEQLAQKFFTETALSNQLAASCNNLAGQLNAVRGQIVQAPGNLSLLLQHYNLSIDYQRPVAIAMGYISYLYGLQDLQVQTQTAVIDALATAGTVIQGVLCTGPLALNTVWASFRSGLKNLPGPDIPGTAGLGSVIDSMFQTDLDAIGQSFTNLCDPAQSSPSQILRNVNGVVSGFVTLEKDVRAKISSVPALLAALEDTLKQQAQQLLDSLLAEIPVPTSVNLSYSWTPQIQSCEPVFLVSDDSTFTVTAEAQAGVTLQAGAQPVGLQASYDITAKLTDFYICLIGDDPFITLHFSSLTFTSQNGSKVDCQAKIEDVTFGAAMQFVQQLADLLDPSDGPFIELAAASIRAGFRFAIPSLTMGAFNLMQLAIEVAVALPFDGTPVRCEFSLSDQQQPFLLSSGIFGGGGFLQLQLGLDGVQMLQGALEFGVCASISIGPLVGSGFVVAGIYFRITGTDSEVCGFVHAHGHMDIFGIISMDVDVYVGICYDEASHGVEGTATFTVSVSIAFFSESFSLSAHYGFQGSSNTNSSLLTLPERNNGRAQAFLVAPDDTLDLVFGAGDPTPVGICCKDEKAPVFIDQGIWTAYYSAFDI